MTIEQQAKDLEACYGTFHRMQTQRHRTEEDRREALAALKNQLATAERTLRLPARSGDPAFARSKLIVWSEMARATLKEMGQDVGVTNAEK